MPVWNELKTIQWFKKFSHEHVELLKQAIETVMEEGLQTGEISKKQTAEELASLLLSSYYGFRVLNVSMQNRMLSDRL